MSRSLHWSAGTGWAELSSAKSSHNVGSHRRLFAFLFTNSTDNNGPGLIVKDTNTFCKHINDCYIFRNSPILQFFLEITCQCRSKFHCKVTSNLLGEGCRVIFTIYWDLLIDWVGHSELATHDMSFMFQLKNDKVHLLQQICQAQRCLPSKHQLFSSCHGWVALTHSLISTNLKALQTNVI